MRQSYLGGFVAFLMAVAAGPAMGQKEEVAPKVEKRDDRNSAAVWLTLVGSYPIGKMTYNYLDTLAGVVRCKYLVVKLQHGNKTLYTIKRFIPAAHNRFWFRFNRQSRMPIPVNASREFAFPLGGIAKYHTYRIRVLTDRGFLLAIFSFMPKIAPSQNHYHVFFTPTGPFGGRQTIKPRTASWRSGKPILSKGGGKNRRK